MGPLERQSETAKGIFKKKEELKTYDINMFLLEEERTYQGCCRKYKSLRCIIRMDEANVRYEKMKEEYNLIEGQVEEIDLAIETARTQMNETGLLKQQLEGQINVLKEQINTARMNDEHYGHRAGVIHTEIESKDGKEKKNWKKKSRMFWKSWKRHVGLMHRPGRS